MKFFFFFSKHNFSIWLHILTELFTSKKFKHSYSMKARFRANNLEVFSTTFDCQIYENYKLIMVRPKLRKIWDTQRTDLTSFASDFPT